MEHLMDAHLNETRERWTPWEADEELLFLIMTNQLTPEIDEAPEAATSEASEIQTAA